MQRAKNQKKNEDLGWPIGFEDHVIPAPIHFCFFFVIAGRVSATQKFQAENENGSCSKGFEIGTTNRQKIHVTPKSRKIVWAKDFKVM